MIYLHRFRFKKVNLNKTIQSHLLDNNIRQLRKIKHSSVFIALRLNYSQIQQLLRILISLQISNEKNETDLQLDLYKLRLNALSECKLFIIEAILHRYFVIHRCVPSKTKFLYHNYCVRDFRATVIIIM